jgi:hypothetical protein
MEGLVAGGGSSHLSHTHLLARSREFQCVQEREYRNTSSTAWAVFLANTVVGKTKALRKIVG